jgi:hypothetical protein
MMIPPFAAAANGRAAARLVVSLHYCHLVLVYASRIPCGGVRVTGPGPGASVGRRVRYCTVWEGLRWAKTYHVEWQARLVGFNWGTRPAGFAPETGVSDCRPNTDAQEPLLEGLLFCFYFLVCLWRKVTVADPWIMHGTRKCYLSGPVRSRPLPRISQVLPLCSMYSTAREHNNSGLASAAACELPVCGKCGHFLHEEIELPPHHSIRRRSLQLRCYPRVLRRDRVSRYFSGLSSWDLMPLLLSQNWVATYHLCCRVVCSTVIGTIFEIPPSIYYRPQREARERGASSLQVILKFHQKISTFTLKGLEYSNSKRVQGWR